MEFYFVCLAFCWRYNRWRFQQFNFFVCLRFLHLIRRPKYKKKTFTYHKTVFLDLDVRYAFFKSSYDKFLFKTSLFSFFFWFSLLEQSLFLIFLVCERKIGLDCAGREFILFIWKYHGELLPIFCLKIKKCWNNQMEFWYISKNNSKF